MGTEDAREFGPIVDSLIGQACERTLATNTIKLRFGTELDPGGDSYIWIDPPWVLQAGDLPVTSSDGYSDETFSIWSRWFDPLNRVVFSGWSVGPTETTFTFANGYKIIVPDADGVREEGYWYAHWYARHTSRKGKETV
jgi:hypothetical protein